MPLNLHAIANNAITRLHPNAQATLYQSTGQDNIKGHMRPCYSQGVPIEVQVQSESATTLYHTNRAGQEEETRKLYLFSQAKMATRVAGIIRPLSRGGDLIFISPANDWFSETWWLVVGVVEDFSQSGWVSVRATMQINAPEGIGEHHAK